MHSNPQRNAHSLDILIMKKKPKHFYGTFSKVETLTRFKLKCLKEAD